MRWTTHTMAIMLGLLMAPAAGYGQQGQRGQQGNRNAAAQTKRAIEEHDNLSNATFAMSADANGNALFTVKAGDFLLEKILDSEGHATIRLIQGKDVVTIAWDQAGYVVSRGKRTARFDARSADGEGRDEVRAVLLGSQAVRSFRRLGVLLENRDEKEDESPAILGTLIDGAIVQMLDGDTGAPQRIGKRVVRKRAAQLRAVKFMPGEMLRDCVLLYENSLLDAWDLFSQCLEWARNVPWWFQNWAENFCTTEWLFRTQQYLWQFVTCIALPI